MSDVVPQIASALIGAAVAVATLGLTLWRQASQNREESKDARRKESSEVVGGVVGLVNRSWNLLLHDTRPLDERYALAQELLYERFPDIQQQLITLRGWHPSQVVADLCREVEESVRVALESVETQLNRLRTDKDSPHIPPATLARALADSSFLLLAIRTYDAASGQQTGDRKIEVAFDSDKRRGAE